MKKEVDELCRRLEWGPDRLARQLGVSRTVVLNWQSGRIKSAPQSLIVETALKALDEGFDADFIKTHILKPGPLSIRDIRQQLRLPKDQPPKGAASPSTEESGENVISNMEQASMEAFAKGHYIQSGLILFQAIETLLRVLIRTQGQSKRIPDKALMEAAGKEQSFLRLILHLDLVFPSNTLSKDLRNLNRRRNDTMHRLFYEYESRRELQEKMREFCLEAQGLRDRLANEVHEKVAQFLAEAGNDRPA